jgi:hypothetical protein
MIPNPLPWVGDPDMSEKLLIPSSLCAVAGIRSVESAEMAVLTKDVVRIKAKGNTSRSSQGRSKEIDQKPPRGEDQYEMENTMNEKNYESKYFRPGLSPRPLGEVLREWRWILVLG